jgi:hypothetical protein
MEGYDVVTVDDKKVGTVVGEQGNFLIVEHGTLRKSKHLLPKELAHADDSEREVRITVGKEMVELSPKLNGEPNEEAVAQYYGLGPIPTLGATEGVEEQAIRDGVEPPPQERAEIREGKEEGVEESPALLGDHLSDVEERR